MTECKPGILKKWLVFSVVTLALLLLAVCWFPSFAEKTVLPRVLAKNGLSGYRVAVHRLGIHGCSLRITGHPENLPIISAGNVRIQWTLTGLLQRRLDDLVLEGLNVHHYASGLHDGSTQSASPETSSRKKDREGKHAEAFHLPIAIDAIRISNSIFFLHNNEGIHILPFSISGQVNNDRISSEENNIQYNIDANIAGQDYEAGILYSQEQNVLSGTLIGDVYLPKLVKTFDFHGFEGDFTGRADLWVEYKIDLSAVTLEKLQVTLRSGDFQLDSKNIALEVGAEEGAVVSLSGAEDSFQITGDGFTVTRPFKSTVSFDANAVFPGNKTVQWQGDISVGSLSGQNIGEKLFVSKTPTVSLKHEGTVKDRDVDIRIFTTSQEDGPEESIELSYDTLRFSADRFMLESQCTWQPENKENQLRATIVFQGDNLIFNGPGMQAGLSKFSFKGEGNLVSIADWEAFNFNGGLITQGGYFELDEHELYVQDMYIELPVPFPWKDNGMKGEFRADQISMHQVQLGKVRGELIPKSSALGFTGSLNTPLLPNNPMAISGAFKLPGNRRPITELSCVIEDAKVDLDKFSSFFPALNDITGSGMIDMKADMVFHKEKFNGQMELALRKWGVEVPKYKMAVQDINMQLNFPDLETIRSSPQQKLSIGKVTNKNFSVENLKAVFQVESPSSLFVEKIGGIWSGGRVFTSAFRLSKDKPEIDAALFCDRLELSQVLSQLSLADAEGNGKVSGRIPVSYSNNEIYIDDGFLFSTPGEKGSLKIKKSKQLTAGIPEDIPQYSPIHFAGAALRDFEYNWAKLLLNSEEDNLVLKLQIDGRPANPLPYRFDSQQNVFIRINDAKSGGIDQPVKLDVNFNVPLNELLRYQSAVLPILRNIK